MPASSRCRTAAFAVLSAAGLLAGGVAAAQDAAYFSPTYAASHGSPYSEVYARTFGAEGGAPPMETAAPPPPARSAPSVPILPPFAPPPVVYVIEDNRLLTYDAEDYARGTGAALSGVALPGNGSAPGGPAPEVRVPTIADRLYAPPPLETAAGAASGGAPVPLVPRN